MVRHVCSREISFTELFFRHNVFAQSKTNMIIPYNSNATVELNELQASLKFKGVFSP